MSVRAFWEFFIGSEISVSRVIVYFSRKGMETVRSCAQIC